jgi:hypothetical protein
VSVVMGELTEEQSSLADIDVESLDGGSIFAVEVETWSHGMIWERGEDQS